jgi:peptide/nickel transport system substrate-binding protein
MGPKGNPALRRLPVRQAIAYGINRPALVNRLFGVINPRLRPLHNTVYLSNSPFYEEHYNTYNYNPGRSRQVLERAGCRRGSDGIYACAGQRLSFRFSSTTGNQRRQLAFEIIQAQLKEVGIELRADFARAPVLFGDDYLTGSNYDLIMFAYVGTPDPGSSVEIMRCNGNQNYQKYCNRTVTRLVDQAKTELDERRKARLFNDADRQYSRDLPSLPLYQLPTYLAFKTSVRGMVDNPTQEGFAWNAYRWALAR